MRKKRQFKAGRCYHLVRRVVHTAYSPGSDPLMPKKKFEDLLDKFGMSKEKAQWLQ